jgi:uncharacterized membrane protein YdjX (TVP38/TMEM64 family)
VNFQAWMAHRRLWCTIAFTAVLLAVVELTGLRSNFNLASVREAFLAHKLAGLLLFTALFSLGNLIHVPGLVFLAAAVLSLGKLWGGLATYIAACVSCMVTFGVFRWIGGNALTQLGSPWARKTLKTLHKRPVRTVILLRAVLQTLPALNITLAMTGLKARDYLLGTVLGLPLPIAVYCVFFDALAQGLKSL